MEAETEPTWFQHICGKAEPVLSLAWSVCLNSWLPFLLRNSLLQVHVISQLGGERDLAMKERDIFMLLLQLSLRFICIFCCMLCSVCPCTQKLISLTLGLYHECSIFGRKFKWIMLLSVGFFSFLSVAGSLVFQVQWSRYVLWHLQLSICLPLFIWDIWAGWHDA